MNSGILGYSLAHYNNKYEYKINKKSKNSQQYIQYILFTSHLRRPRMQLVYTKATSFGAVIWMFHLYKWDIPDVYPTIPMVYRMDIPFMSLC